MSDMEGIVKGSVSGSCTECSECFVTSENKRSTKCNKKYIKNKGKMKSKQKGKCFEKIQESGLSLKLIKDSNSNVVAKKESIKVPISCSCPCITSYIKFLNTVEMCNCCRKNQKFDYTFPNQNDLIESEKQGFSSRKKEPRFKDWKGTMKIITSSMSLPFNLLKIRSKKKNKFLKVKSNYENMFNEQYLFGNGDTCNNPVMNMNSSTNKSGVCEENGDKFTCENPSSVSMDRIFHLCENNNIQGLHGCYGDIESSANKEFKDRKEIKSSIVQDVNAKLTENVASTNFRQRNEFKQTHSEIFSNLGKNDSLSPTNLQHIQNKKSVNVLCPLTELCDTSRKEELHSTFRGKLRCNVVQKFNSLGRSQRRYVMGIRNNSKNSVKECIDKLLADMEQKSRSYTKVRKGLGGNTEDANVLKSGVCINGKDIPKEISKLKQLLIDKILLHQQECETPLYTCGTSCKINTRIKSENIKFLEIKNNYSDVMNDLETLCEEQDLIHNNQSSNKNMSEKFVKADNSENESIQSAFNGNFSKSTPKSKLKAYDESIIEPVLEKNDRNEIFSNQIVFQKKINIPNEEEILTLDSGDSVQERNFSRFKSPNIETINDAKDTEFSMQSSVNNKQKRSKRKATKAWQEKQLTESDTTQSPNP